MKETFLIPLKYLLIYLATALALILGVYIYSWCSNIALQAPEGWHMASLLYGAYVSILPASIITLIIIILVIQRHRGNALLMFLATWLCFSGVQLLLFTAILPLDPVHSREILPIEVPQRIHAYHEASVYIDSSFRPGAPAAAALRDNSPRLIGGAIEHAGPGELTVGGVSIERSPRNPFFARSLQAGTIVDSAFRDFRIMTSAFSYAAHVSTVNFLVTIGAFGFMMTAGWIFGRFTSWPLLNTIYLLFFTRSVLFIFSLLLSPEAAELLNLVFPGLDISAYLPHVFAAIGALLIAWDLLFVPFNRYAPPLQGKGR